jgi:hypothetical protein
MNSARCSAIGTTSCSVCEHTFVSETLPKR